MINVNAIQDLTAGSGLLHVGYLADIYHSFMDESLQDFGRDVILHLEPQVQSDTITNSQPQPSQYNPFFGRTGIPSPTTKNTGVRITPRDVTYKAHIRIGPKTGPDDTGMGNLKENEAMITVVAEALSHIKSARSISIEGRRYGLVGDPRPIGFLDRKYIMVKLGEIQESDIKDDVGTNG
jgi:hypothetical protein